MDTPAPTSHDSDYASAVRWIYDRINYERVQPTRGSTHFRLDRMERLLQLIDAPHERIPALHIAGTKGKGSTAAMLASILRSSNIRTALFTSPHIHCFEERMRVDGDMPSAAELTDLVHNLQHRLATAESDLLPDGPTYFEVATLLAWMFFDRREAQLAVLETGLGGRLDCTNVCHPVLTLITAIGLDHTHILGDTVSKIAAEKSGILKAGVPLVSWPANDEAAAVIMRTADDLGCLSVRGTHELKIIAREQHGTSQDLQIETPRRVHSVTLPLAGEHQCRNAAMAVCAADLLSDTYAGITRESISEGLLATKWPMRFEVVPGAPPTILDVAHNPDSIAALIRTLKESRIDAAGQRVVIFASSTDKDAAGMLNQLAKCFSAVVLTQFLSNPRATPVDELISMLPANVTAKNAASPQEALQIARQVAGPDGLICATGSIFLAAEIGAVLQSE